MCGELLDKAMQKESLSAIDNLKIIAYNLDIEPSKMTCRHLKPFFTSVQDAKFSTIVHHQYKREGISHWSIAV